MRQVLVLLVTAAMLVTVVPGGTAAGPQAGEFPQSVSEHDRGPGVTDTTVATTQAVESCAATPQSGAPAEDVIGWHDGYWYDDRLSIDDSDGYTDDELDALVARTAARYEALRCWEIDETPPVEIKRRSEINTSESFIGNVTESSRTFLNAQYETLLMIGPERDAIQVRKDNLGSSVLGYYDPQAEEIVLVVEDGSQLQVDEFTLAQEIGHATQDQRYNLSQFNASIHDLNIAETGLIEGDANLVEQRYKQRCNGVWNGTCYRPDTEQRGGGGLADFGPYMMSFHPYVDGPTWVESLYQRGGWDRVDAAYQNPPQTTTELIEPDTYPDQTPPTVTLDVPSPGGWTQVTGSGADYQIIGEAGIAAMFMSPTIETRGRNGVLAPQAVYNFDGREVNIQDPYNYNQPASDGWAGDRMQVYTNDRGTTTTVWKIGWETPTDGSEFTGTYRDLLEYRGARQVDANGTVYRFTEASEFEGAVAIIDQGTTTTVINGPSVEAVSQFSQGADVSEQDGFASVPGFGAVAVLLALFVSAGALLRRR
jgi:hypothetical protein